MKYAVVVERTGTGYSAYFPDLPGIGVAGKTVRQTMRLAQEAAAIYIEEKKARGQAVPKPTTRTDYLEAKAA